MNKYRQMAVKVVYLSIPLLKGDLRIDVRDSGRKNRQLNLWHAGIVATSGQKKQPSTEAKNVSFHFLSLPSVAGGIWSCEPTFLCSPDSRAQGESASISSIARPRPTCDGRIVARASSLCFWSTACPRQ